MLFKITCIIGFVLITGNLGSEEPEPTKTIVNQGLIDTQIKPQWDREAKLKPWKNFGIPGLKMNAKDDINAVLSLGLKTAEEILEKETNLWSSEYHISNLRKELDE